MRHFIKVRLSVRSSGMLEMARALVSLVEEPNQILARHVQDISGLLCRELLPDGHNPEGA